MEAAMLIGLVNNAALLLALCLFYDLLVLQRAGHPPLQRALTGAILGGIGIAVMSNPWPFGNGVAFDTRSVLLCISGLFFGTIPALVAMVMTAAYRLYQGGAGAWTGVAVIISAASIGLGWRHLRKNRVEGIPPFELYVLGLLVHVVMLLLMLTLPRDMALRVLSAISMPVMLIYPLATLFLGMLMSGQEQRRRIEGALARERALLRAVLDSAPDAIYVKDAAARKIITNPADLANMGKTEAEVLGKLDREIYPPEVAARFYADDLAVLQSGQPLINREELATMQSGEERWLLTSKLPLRDESGQIIGLVGIGRDITERKRAEQALRESESKYRALFESAAAPIWEEDFSQVKAYFAQLRAAGVQDWRDYFQNHLEAVKQCAALVRVVDVSATALALFRASSKEELLRDLPAFFDEESWPTFTEEMIALAEGRGAFEGEIAIRGLQGERMWLLLRLLVSPESRETLARVLVSFVDITARKEAEEKRALLEEQLMQSRRLESVGLLAGGVAHDLNNMLSPILGYAEILRDELPADSPHQTDVREISRAGERARDLVRQLLAFARKQMLEMKPLDLNQVIGELARMLRRTLRDDIALETDLAPGLGAIRGDSGQIGQVLLNLAVNAQDAMPQGGTLRIETSAVRVDEAFAASREEVKPGDYVRMTVRDTGAGMDKETMSRLFEPFFTTKEVGRGTGLGLATVYGIVRQHDGYIEIESAPGAGSVFRVYWPQAGEAIAPVETEEAAAPARGAETILAVEDQSQVREMVCRMLRRQGYKVFAASNGRAALEIAAAHSGEIQLLITDLIMPGMNGRALYEHLRQAQPELRALFMSGYSEEEIGDHGALEEGMAFIQKPFTMPAFIAQVRHSLDG
jgi:PAS domain S-box-containing protein